VRPLVAVGLTALLTSQISTSARLEAICQLFLIGNRLAEDRADVTLPGSPRTVYPMLQAASTADQNPPQRRHILCPGRFSAQLPGNEKN
jgi:hypothetical protein